MNFIAKVFCRIFQGAFHLALPILPYREPEIYDSINGAVELIKKKKYSSVLLVTDGFLRKSGITAELEKHLKESGIKCSVYDGTSPNPTVRNVETARRMYVNEGCQCLIAFGGGSSIDCAKAVGARIVYPKKSLNKLKGLLRVMKRLPDLIAIPTTAGTGSEVTVTAVITDRDSKHKYTMNNFTMIPRYAVLDPAVTVTLPPHLTATTGMDALTHAVEAYIGGSTSKETRRLSLEAVKLIFENIEKAYNNGSDLQARHNMLIAANKAGIAFSKSYVGYIHAVAHSLGGQYNIPHGLANSVLMPVVLEDYGECVYKKLRLLGITAGVCSENDDASTGAMKFIEAIKELNRKMNIPCVFPEIKEEDIATMAKHAAKEANPLYPVPRIMSAKELEKFYRVVSVKEEIQKGEKKDEYRTNTTKAA